MHMQGTGRMDGGYGSLEEFRREVILPYLNHPISALEIGPFIRPTLEKAEADLKTLDCYDTDELRQHAIRIGENPYSVIHVDYVCKDENYCNVVTDEFDMIIAAHVAEHVVGFVGYFQTLRKLLKHGGHCMIVLPDKRYSFDKFRSDTSLAYLIFQHLQPEFPAKAFHALESAMLYDKGYINAENVAEERLSIDSLRKALDGWHPGVHSHVFQFEDVITKVFAPLCAMGLIDFDVLEARMSHQFGEFVVVLRAGRECTSWESVKDFYSLSRDTITPKRGLLHALESKKNMLRRWYSSRGNQDGAGDPRTKK